MLFISVLALDIDLSNIPPTHCPIESKQAESCWLERAKNVASIGAAFWATTMSTSLAHELGHKVVGKALFPPHTSKITVPLNLFKSSLIEFTPKEIQS
jgi:hypothetical protein